MHDCDSCSFFHSAAPLVCERWRVLVSWFHCKSWQALNRLCGIVCEISFWLLCQMKKSLQTRHCFLGFFNFHRTYTFSSVIHRCYCHKQRFRSKVHLSLAVASEFSMGDGHELLSKVLRSSRLGSCHHRVGLKAFLPSELFAKSSKEGVWPRFGTHTKRSQPVLGPSTKWPRTFISRITKRFRFAATRRMGVPNLRRASFQIHS